MSQVPTEEKIPTGGAADRRDAIRGAVWGGIESFTRASVGLAITPLIITAFGLEGLGLWAACWSTAQMAGLFDLGIGAIYSRFTAHAIARHDAAALNGTIAAGMGFHLIATSILAGASILALPSINRAISQNTPFADVAPMVLGCAVVAVLSRLVLSVFRGVVAGAQRLDLLGRIGAGMAVVEGIGSATILLSGGSLRAMALNALAASILTSLFEGGAAYRVCPQLRLRPFHARRSDWREVLSFGLKVQVIRGAEILARHVPRLALAAGPGLAVAGVYDLGSRVAAALTTVGTVPLPVIAPMASRLEAQSLGSRLESLIQRSTRYVALLVIPLATLVMLDSAGILRAWTGRPDSAEAAATAQLLSLAAVLTLLISPLRLALRGMGYAGVEAISAMSSSLLHLVLALALATRFGASGVAWSAIAASIVAAVTLAAGARRIDSGRFTDTIRQATAATVLAGIAAFAAGWGFRVVTGAAFGGEVDRLAVCRYLLGETAVVLAVFVLVAAATGGVRRDDLSLARVAVREA